jgi:hypothetical protein
MRNSEHLEDCTSENPRSTADWEEFDRYPSETAEPMTSVPITKAQNAATIRNVDVRLWASSKRFFNHRRSESTRGGSKRSESPCFEAIEPIHKRTESMSSVVS